MSRLYWIKLRAAGRIAIMARPRAGEWLELEVNDWKKLGVEIVVSLLEPEEISELALPQEAELCRSSGIDFISFPIRDRGVPASEQEVLQLADSLIAFVKAGRSIAIHCRAGIGRSSLIAACALICCGIGAEVALERIKDARGLSVPDTDEQRDWLSGFARTYRDEVSRSRTKSHDG